MDKKTFGHKFKKGPSNHAESFQMDWPQSSEIQHVKSTSFLENKKKKTQPLSHS